MIKTFALSLLLIAGCWAPAPAAQYLRDEVIPPGIARDSEIAPTGEANAICITNAPGVTPAIALCSTVDLTGKTVLYKIPEYAFGSIPAGTPFVVVNNSASANVCNGSGSAKAVCWWDGSAWVALTAGGMGDPGGNGLVARTALNTLVARALQTVNSARLTCTIGDGVSGNPLCDTGTDIPTKSGNNTFTGPNTFNDKLVVPRKATPGDLGLLSNGEVFVDGELLRFKSNTGLVYTLYKIGDTVVRTVFGSTDPGASEDGVAGFVVGDIFINDGGTSGTPSDDTAFIAVNVTTGQAKWVPVGGVLAHVQLTGLSADDHSSIYTAYYQQSGAPSAASCNRPGEVSFNTTGERAYGCYSVGGDPVDFGDQGSAYNIITDGTNVGSATGSEAIRFARAPRLPTQVEHFTLTAAFANQPANDGVEVVSSAAGDTTQTVTISGTTNGGDAGDIHIETVTLNGTTFVATTKTDWADILAVKLSATTTGNVTVREASADQTITTITAGGTRAADQATVFYKASDHGKSRSGYFPANALNSDGTNCANPTQATINSGARVWSIICTDNDASTIYGHAPLKGYNGGTVTFDLHYVQTAADTNVLHSDIAASCRNAGDTLNNTWGTEIAIDDAAVSGSNVKDVTTSAAVTPNGTCSDGSELWFRWQMDATGTTTAVATLHILGIGVNYTEAVVQP